MLLNNLRAARVEHLLYIVLEVLDRNFSTVELHDEVLVAPGNIPHTPGEEIFVIFIQILKTKLLIIRAEPYSQ